MLDGKWVNEADSVKTRNSDLGQYITEPSSKYICTFHSFKVKTYLIDTSVWCPYNQNQQIECM